MILEMPNYEYQCEVCNKLTEEYFSNVSDRLDNIPCACGNTARRIISATHFDFPHLPKLMNEEHKRRIERRRQQISEQNYKIERSERHGINN